MFYIPITYYTVYQKKSISKCFRRAAIEHLVKEDAPTDVILKFWSTLDTEGWIFIEGKLPQGWRVR